MGVSIVQESELQQSTASGTWTFNFASAVTQNNVVVLILRLATTGRTPNLPTSSGSATFAQVTSSGTGIGGLWMWSATEANSSNTEYKLTFSGSLTAAGVFQAYELTGMDGATATSSDASPGQTSGPNPRMTTASGLTIPSGGLLIGAISTAGLNASYGTVTDPANFTRDFNTVSGTIGSFYAANSTTAASGVTGTITIGTQRSCNGLAAVWSEAGGGGGGGGATSGNLLLLGVG